MITKRDKQIIRHIEDYGFITISQTKDIFMTNKSRGYEIARRRLSEIQRCNVTFDKDNYPLRVKKNKLTNENIFYYDKYPTYHMLAQMNFYAKLVALGCALLEFKQEKSWSNKKYRSDIFTTVKLGDSIYFFIVEIINTNPDTHIRNYERLYKTEEVQKVCSGVFPRIVIVGGSKMREKTFLKTYYVDEDLSNLSIIFT